jgi:hypothetical protein
VGEVRVAGWQAAPRVMLVLPEEGGTGWADAAYWAAQLEAWGIPAARQSPADAAGGLDATVVVVPAAAVDQQLGDALVAARARGSGLLLAGRPTPAAAAILGLCPAEPVRVHGFQLAHGHADARVAACLPGPDEAGRLLAEPTTSSADLAAGPAEVLARWSLASGAGGVGPVAVAARPGEGGEGPAVWFGLCSDVLDWRGTEAAAALAEAALEAAAHRGLVALARWPRGKPAALVVDGDVDHPTGVDPECSRYVTAAIETARRAGFDAYGMFVAGANLDAEPWSFPAEGRYFNHSQTHPYSYWDPAQWRDLDAAGITRQLRAARATFARRLGRSDLGVFRLPHFQQETYERTAAVLDDLGYVAESSVAANRSVTAGLPYHPARRPWGSRPADAGFARTHPEPAGRHAFLQLPISTDPVHPDFPNGCCSYQTLGEGVRARTADPPDYERVLGDVVQRAVRRRSLAHLFIDPPDAGYGRLPGDRQDYAGAVERWLADCLARGGLAVLPTDGLARWWLAREAAVPRLTARVEDGALVLDLPEAPAGAAVALLPPRPAGAPSPRWRTEAIDG